MIQIYHAAILCAAILQGVVATGAVMMAGILLPQDEPKVPWLFSFGVWFVAVIPMLWPYIDCDCKRKCAEYKAWPSARYWNATFAIMLVLAALAEIIQIRDPVFDSVAFYVKATAFLQMIVNLALLALICANLWCGYDPPIHAGEEV